MYNRLCDIQKCKNIQSQLDLRASVHNLGFPYYRDIQKHLIHLKKFFFRLGQINDPIFEKDKSGIIMHFLPSSLSFVSVIIQATKTSSTYFCSLSASEAKRRIPARQAHSHPHPAYLATELLITTGAHTSHEQDKNWIVCYYCDGRGHV